MRNARLGGCAAALTLAVVLAVATGASYAHRGPHDRGPHDPDQPPIGARLPGARGGSARAARRAHAAHGLGDRGPQLSPPLARLLRAAHRLPAGGRGVARARGVRRPRREQRIPPSGGVQPVGDRLQLPSAQPVHFRKSARAGRRRTRADGPRAGDRRPVGQPAVQRDALGPPADRRRRPANAEQRDQERLHPVPAREPRGAAGARDRGRDPGRAHVHGRPGLRRPRLPGTRLLRPR